MRRRSSSLLDEVCGTPAQHSDLPRPHTAPAGLARLPARHAPAAVEGQQFKLLPLPQDAPSHPLTEVASGIDQPLTSAVPDSVQRSSEHGSLSRLLSSRISALSFKAIGRALLQPFTSRHRASSQFSALSASPQVGRRRSVPGGVGDLMQSLMMAAVPPALDMYSLSGMEPSRAVEEAGLTYESTLQQGSSTDAQTAMLHLRSFVLQLLLKELCSPTPRLRSIAAVAALCGDPAPSAGPLPALALDAVMTPCHMSLPGALLVADISGFTRLTEQLSKKGPQGVELLTRCLNNYFSRIIAHVQAYGGDVCRFAGDSVIVAFWPTETEEQTDDKGLAAASWRATQCAWTLAQTLGCMRAMPDGRVHPVMDRHRKLQAEQGHHAASGSVQPSASVSTRARGRPGQKRARGLLLQGVSSSQEAELPMRSRTVSQPSATGVSSLMAGGRTGLGLSTTVLDSIPDHQPLCATCITFRTPIDTQIASPEQAASSTTMEKIHTLQFPGRASAPAVLDSSKTALEEHAGTDNSTETEFGGVAQVSQMATFAGTRRAISLPNMGFSSVSFRPLLSGLMGTLPRWVSLRSNRVAPRVMSGSSGPSCVTHSAYDFSTTGTSRTEGASSVLHLPAIECGGLLRHRAVPLTGLVDKRLETHNTACRKCGMHPGFLPTTAKAGSSPSVDASVTAGTMDKWQGPATETVHCGTEERVSPGGKLLGSIRKIFSGSRSTSDAAVQQPVDAEHISYQEEPGSNSSASTGSRVHSYDQHQVSADTWDAGHQCLLSIKVGVAAGVIHVYHVGGSVSTSRSTHRASQRTGTPRWELIVGDEPHAEANPERRQPFVQIAHALTTGQPGDVLLSHEVYRLVAAHCIVGPPGPTAAQDAQPFPALAPAAPSITGPAGALCATTVLGSPSLVGSNHTWQLLPGRSSGSDSLQEQTTISGGSSYSAASSTSSSPASIHRNVGCGKVTLFEGHGTQACVSSMVQPQALGATQHSSYRVMGMITHHHHSGLLEEYKSLNDTSTPGEDKLSTDTITGTSFAHLSCSRQVAAVEVLRMHLERHVLRRVESGLSLYLNELRCCTLCFIGFPSLQVPRADGCSGSPAASPVRSLQQCVEVVHTCVAAAKGTVLQCRWDEKGFIIIAGFGLPGALEGGASALQGIRAAVALTQQCETNRHVACVGVTTGDVLCAVVGSSSRSEYTVFGPAINLAARLMVTARAADSEHGQVLCDQSTRDALALLGAQSTVLLTPLSALMLKGIDSPVAAYKVVSQPRTRQCCSIPLAVELMGSQQPDVQDSVTVANSDATKLLIGRASELAAIDAALARLHDPAVGSLGQDAEETLPSRASLLLLEGAAGMGKGHLLQEAARRAHAAVQHRVPTRNKCSDGCEQARVMPAGVVLVQQMQEQSHMQAFSLWGPIFEQLLVKSQQTNSGFESQHCNRSGGAVSDAFKPHAAVSVLLTSRIARYAHWAVRMAACLDIPPSLFPPAQQTEVALPVATQAAATQAAAVAGGNPQHFTHRLKPQSAHRHKTETGSNRRRQQVGEAIKQSQMLGNRRRIRVAETGDRGPATNNRAPWLQDVDGAPDSPGSSWSFKHVRLSWMTSSGVKEEEVAGVFERQALRAKSVTVVLHKSKGAVLSGPRKTLSAKFQRRRILSSQSAGGSSRTVSTKAEEEAAKLGSSSGSEVESSWGRRQEQTGNSSSAVGTLMEVLQTTLQVLVEAVGPLVLLVHELQSADISSLTLLAAVLQQTRASKLLVIASLRDTTTEAPDTYAATRQMLMSIRLLPGTKTLQLQPLTVDDTQHMMQALQPPHWPVVTSAVAAVMWQRTGGLPLYIQQLMLYMQQQQQQDRREGSKDVAGPSSNMRSSSGVPPVPGQECGWLTGTITLRQVVVARLDKLAPSQQLTLKVCSVLGSAIPLALLARIHPITGSLQHLQRELNALQPDFLHPDASSAGLLWRWSQALTRDVVYSLVPVTQRQQLHKQLAQALEDDQPATSTSAPGHTAPSGALAGVAAATVAYHWVQAVKGSETADIAATLKAMSVCEATAVATASEKGGLREALRLYQQADDLACTLSALPTSAGADTADQSLPYGGIDYQLTLRRIGWQHRVALLYVNGMNSDSSRLAALEHVCNGLQLLGDLSNSPGQQPWVQVKMQQLLAQLRPGSWSVSPAPLSATSSICLHALDGGHMQRAWVEQLAGRFKAGFADLLLGELPCPWSSSSSATSTALLLAGRLLTLLLHIADRQNSRAMRGNAKLLARALLQGNQQMDSATTSFAHPVSDGTGLEGSEQVNPNASANQRLASGLHCSAAAACNAATTIHEGLHALRAVVLAARQRHDEQFVDSKLVAR